MRGERTVRLTFLFALLALLALAIAPGAARADALDEAKAAGYLGERYDGYLGVVNDKVPAAAKALAADINAKRKVHYGKIAAKEGTQVSAVAAIAGAKLVKNAPSGQYVMPSEGAGWTRVP